MEGVMDGTSVPTLENWTGFGPELPREEEKDEETIKTAQTRMDNDWGISIEGSTVEIGFSNAAEASSTLVASASNSGTVYCTNTEIFVKRVNTTSKIIRKKIRTYVSSTTHTKEGLWSGGLYSEDIVTLIIGIGSNNFWLKISENILTCNEINKKATTMIPIETSG